MTREPSNASDWQTCKNKQDFWGSSYCFVQIVMLIRIQMHFVLLTTIIIAICPRGALLNNLEKGQGLEPPMPPFCTCLLISIQSSILPILYFKQYDFKCIIQVHFWGKMNKVVWQRYICSCLILWLDPYQDLTWLEVSHWLDLICLYCDLRLAWDLNMCDLPPPLSNSVNYTNISHLHIYNYTVSPATIYFKVQF